MVNIVSGIITTEGNKTVSAIYQKLTCNHDRICGSRFLGEYKPNSEYVDYKGISYSLKTVKTNGDEDKAGFLIIDDSLSKKDKSTKEMESLDYHHSYSDGKTMWSHFVVTSHYKLSEYALPLSYKLYLRKQYFGNKATKFFKTNSNLPCNSLESLHQLHHSHTYW